MTSECPYEPVPSAQAHLGSRQSDQGIRCRHQEPMDFVDIYLRVLSDHGAHFWVVENLNKVTGEV